MRIEAWKVWLSCTAFAVALFAWSGAHAQAIGGSASLVVSTTSSNVQLPASLQTYPVVQIAQLPGSTQEVFFAFGATGVTANPAGTTATVTITVASPAVVTWTGDNFSLNTPVIFTTTGSLPFPLVAGTAYYAIPVTANTFQVAAAPNGAAINTQGAQSGTHTGTTGSAALPVNGIACYNVGPNGWVAAVTASATATLRITQMTTCPFVVGGSATSLSPTTTPLLMAPGETLTTLSGWTSATAGNTTQSLMAANQGAPALIAQLNQTSTISGGAVTIEGTYDGTNWVTIPVGQVLNPNTMASLTNPYTLVASTNQPFLILTQGYQAARIRLSTTITGTATVTPFVTLLPSNPAISALLYPLAAGSAIIGKVGFDQTTPNVTNHVSQGPYPDTAVPYTASATGTTGATTATLAGASSVTTYLCGFSIRANATAAATGNATVTGTISGTLNFTQWTAPLASGLGVTEETFTPCVPASAVNTSIAVVSAAPGTGGIVSVTAWGYKL